METVWLVLVFVGQAICYLLILAYKCYDYRKNGDKKKPTNIKPKLKSEFVETKRVRTPAERIKTWMDTAQFRVSPDPEFDLALPTLARLNFETMDTPRLISETLPRVPVIARDIEMATPNVAQVENIATTSSSSLPDPILLQRNSFP
eukprot:g8465.t1